MPQVLSLVVGPGRIYAGCCCGRVLVGKRNDLRLWHRTPEEDSHTGQVRSLALDGRCLISASFDTTVKLWEVSLPEEPLSLTCMCTLSVPAKTGTAVWAVTVVDNRLYSTSADGTVNVWTMDGVSAEHPPQHTAHFPLLMGAAAGGVAHGRGGEGAGAGGGVCINGSGGAVVRGPAASSVVAADGRLYVWRRTALEMWALPDDVCDEPRRLTATKAPDHIEMQCCPLAVSGRWLFMLVHAPLASRGRPAKCCVQAWLLSCCSNEAPLLAQSLPLPPMPAGEHVWSLAVRTGCLFLMTSKLAVEDYAVHPPPCSNRFVARVWPLQELCVRRLSCFQALFRSALSRRCPSETQISTAPQRALYRLFTMYRICGLRAGLVAAVHSPRRVLMFGENDFSFAFSLASCRMGLHIEATDITSSESSTLNRGRLLEDGHGVRFGINATTEVCAGYQLVVFNFPFMANDRAGTRELIQSFLRNVCLTADVGTWILLGLATQKPDRDSVSFQYGHRDVHAGENLVAEAVLESYRLRGERVLRVASKQDPDFYLSFPEYGHQTASGGGHRGCWEHNDRTAFFLLVDTGQVSKEEPLRSLQILRSGCLDQPHRRVQISSAITGPAHRSVVVRV
eukprot:NODE_3277_length_2061_cov_10.064116.p1 GENE.NODE_3277_length_2061_cov_10.064116~~NODE_3277_length_2061_cov_10.064116.p1  ORF type:complete len:622 (-),score=90.41 NODE_3277_length_2061_cov_10.064116:57-1922(-)